MIQALIFYMLAAILIASATLVVLARNPVHSVLWLILSFFNAAGLFLMLGAEFVAMILLIVYVGAVAVLFLFVVMMLNIDFASLRAGFAKYLPFGVLLAVVLLSELLIVAGAWQTGILEQSSKGFAVPNDPAIENTRAIGQVLYTKYVLIFQSAGLLLLTAMIGAIVLTQRQRTGVKRQDIGRQNARTPENAIEVVSGTTGEGIKL